MAEAREALALFQEANLSEDNGHPDGEDSEVRQHVEIWKAPPIGLVKMNWDAAVDSKQGKIGLGCIARTSNGAFLAAQSMTKMFRTEPAVAEALATSYAVIFSRELGLQRIIFKGDAQTIVKEVNKEGPCLSKYGLLVEGIQGEMRTFETAQFNFVRREANKAAHRLAKLATTHVTDATWLDSVPPEVCCIVRGEANISSL
ncbi:uncharacterized protein LOC132174026 [Corylus avellana]|uniref:uncharacterized protein LOC132174026 n=1 Tax=Corylus avellana TaxID=13451 RepID=UPI00286CD180|nr:uncharacterized protein LOC132174026 [Corylus avellana]